MIPTSEGLCQKDHCSCTPRYRASRGPPPPPAATGCSSLTKAPRQPQSTLRALRLNSRPIKQAPVANPNSQQTAQARIKSLELWPEHPIQPNTKGQSPGLSHMNPKSSGGNSHMISCLSATQFVRLGVGCSAFCLQRNGSYSLNRGLYWIHNVCRGFLIYYRSPCGPVACGRGLVVYIIFIDGFIDGF